MSNLDTAYLLALHSIDGLGPVRLKKILDYFKDPKLAWSADSEEIKRLGIPQNTVNLFLEKRTKLDPLGYMEDIQKSGIKWLTIFDESYPKLLSQIYDPPIVFYYKGDVDWDSKSIAVVGTRKITGYGKAVTEGFTKDLSSAGLTIVSGLAKGVDSVAHRTTIDNKGKTIAVLGSGLNKIYPYENKKLAEEITQGHGAVISEFPPEYPSLPGNFPARNRIISGLSLGVLVAEAAEDSGSLITARFAIEQGREVFAVPGPITSTLSRGPIDLINEGAKAVFSADEILDELGLSHRSQSLDPRLTANLSDEEKKILEILDNEQLHIDEICRKLNLSVAQVSGTLLKMEISGLLQNLGSGMYCKI